MSLLNTTPRPVAWLAPVAHGREAGIGLRGHLAKFRPAAACPGVVRPRALQLLEIGQTRFNPQPRTRGDSQRVSIVHRLKCMGQQGCGCGIGWHVVACLHGTVLKRVSCSTVVRRYVSQSSCVGAGRTIRPDRQMKTAKTLRQRNGVPSSFNRLTPIAPASFTPHLASLLDEPPLPSVVMNGTVSGSSTRLPMSNAGLGAALHGWRAETHQVPIWMHRPRRRCRYVPTPARPG